MQGATLFAFRDGAECRAVDSFEALGRLTAAGVSLRELAESIESLPRPGDVTMDDAPAVMTAFTGAADACCVALGVAPFDPATGRGMTAADRVLLLTRFLQFVCTLTPPSVPRRPYRGGLDAPPAGRPTRGRNRFPR